MSLGNDCVSYFVEWIEGSPNLNGSDFNLLWIYLVFMNGLWVVVPLLLLWDSFARISNVSDDCAAILTHRFIVGTSTYLYSQNNYLIIHPPHK